MCDRALLLDPTDAEVISNKEIITKANLNAPAPKPAPARTTPAAPVKTQPAKTTPAKTTGTTQKKK